jgi:hypothetical protein
MCPDGSHQAGANSLSKIPLQMDDAGIRPAAHAPPRKPE